MKYHNTFLLYPLIIYVDYILTIYLITRLNYTLLLNTLTTQLNQHDGVSVNGDTLGKNPFWDYLVTNAAS